MLSVVYLTDQMTGGRYRDVVQVAERLSKTYGSKNNAVAQMVRQSALFRYEMRKIEAETKKEPRKRAGAA